MDNIQIMMSTRIQIHQIIGRQWLIIIRILRREVVFINTNQCHIQMGAGIYSMSDGAITRYLGTNGMAGLDALGSNSEDVKAEGFVSEMKDQSWELLSGKVTVDEGAKIAKRYFEEGKYFPVAQGVTIDVPEVSVFALKTSMDMIMQFVANTRGFRLRMEIMDNVIFMTGIRCPQM